MPAPEPEDAWLRSLATELIEQRVANAAAIGVATLGDDGQLNLRKASVGASKGAWFDLASVTKTATALTACVLAGRGALSLDAPLEDLLPELRGTPGGRGSLRRHLAHRAGLVPHVALYDESERGRPFRRGEALRRAALAIRASDPDVAVYSDLGYILAGAALERVANVPLENLVSEIVGADAELGSARLVDAQVADVSWVPTEWTPARGGRLVGVVHDDNAWALEGRRLAGHAGLFGTLDGVLRLGANFLAAHRSTHPWTEAVAEMTRRFDGGSFRMGFDGVSPRSSAGTLASPDTFGHLGFTGTSLWVDPSRGAAVTLLTNRVYFGRDPSKIKAARPRVHDAVWAMLDAERR